MIDRKIYLEMCQANAVNPQSAVVKYNGAEYYPAKLVVWFDGKGAAMNTARMTAKVGKSVIEARLEDIFDKSQSL
jgi:hypothetical protein